MYQLFKKNFLQVILLASIFLIFTPTATNAVEELYINGSYCANYYPLATSLPRCQTFITDNKFITRLNAQVRHTATSPNNLTMKLSDTACYDDNINSTVFTPAQMPIGASYPELEVNQSFASGTELYISFTTPNAASYYSIALCAFYPYGQEETENNGSDYNFDVWVDEDITSGTYDSNFDYDLNQTFPDYNTIVSQTCIIGNECNIWFSFNELAIGYRMYLTYNASSTIISNSIASGIVMANEYWQNGIEVPAVDTEGTIKYDLLLDAGSFGWNIKTGIAIKWIDSDYWEELIQERFGADVEEYCAEDVICADVATSSDFFYGFNCGARKVLCWALAPTNNSKKYVVNSVTALEESFPFNMIFTFLHRSNKIIDDSQATTSTVTLGIPWKGEIVQGSSTEYTILPIITADTVPNALGSSFEEVKRGAKYFIWVMTAFLIVLIIYKTL